MAWCVVHGHLDGAANLICVTVHGRGAAFTLLRGAGSIRGHDRWTLDRQRTAQRPGNTTYHSPMFAEYSSSVTCSIQFE